MLSVAEGFGLVENDGELRFHVRQGRFTKGLQKRKETLRNRLVLLLTKMGFKGIKSKKSKVMIGRDKLL